jgi:hypothetical protein
MSNPLAPRPTPEFGHRIDPSAIELVDTQPIDITYLMADSTPTRED